MIPSKILHPLHPQILGHYFIIKKKNTKSKKYIKILELTFEQLYESEFQKEEHNLFPSKNIPLDWIIWYDSYNHKFRDALYSYGYRCWDYLLPTLYVSIQLYKLGFIQS